MTTSIMSGSSEASFIDKGGNTIGAFIQLLSLSIDFLFLSFGHDLIMFMTLSFPVSLPFALPRPLCLTTLISHSMLIPTYDLAYLVKGLVVLNRFKTTMVETLLTLKIFNLHAAVLSPSAVLSLVLAVLTYSSRAASALVAAGSAVVPRPIFPLVICTNPSMLLNVLLPSFLRLSAP
ncbi:hypothetical protein Tco_1297934 [Tanacetum coccineum]